MAEISTKSNSVAEKTENSTEINIFDAINSIVNETLKSINNGTQNNPNLENNKENTNISATFARNQTNISGNEVWLWIFVIYCINIALGVVFNGISFVSLMKTKRNGTLSIITQLSSVDIFASWISIIELLAIKNKSWPFSAELCPFFAGSETLSNTLTLYLIISLNYHTISLCNIKTPPASTGSCDASQECLVRDVNVSQAAILSTNSQSSQSSTASTTTTTNSPHHKPKDLSVVIPCILIWFTCLSLSIPQFTLSSTIESFSTKNITCTCTLMDDSKILINLLAIFKVFIPFCLMASSISILTYKLVKYVRNDSFPTIFTKKSHNIVYYLIFCLVLNFLYVITSWQRLILYGIFVYMTPSLNALKMAKIYKLPPFFDEFTGGNIAIALCMLHYSGIFLRFLVYVCLLPKFKSILCNNFLTCFKPKEL